MKKIVFIRHGESEWNKQNLFTGWSDVELSETGQQEAKEAGRLLKEEGYDFDICFTSYLKRAIHTANAVLDQMDREWIPVLRDWHLNERHYGALQGLNKAETAAKYGENQVKVWRRSFAVRPPLLEEDDPRAPRNMEAYHNVDPKELPLAESLKDTIARAVPYYEDVIKKEVAAGKRVLVAAHGNSLRALVMHLDKLSEEEIINVNIPTGVPLVYELSDDLTTVENKYYLGDVDAVAAKMDAVKKQGKKQ